LVLKATLPVHPDMLVMEENDPVVYVVDDDPSICRAIKRLMGSAGLDVRTFGSGEEFFQAERDDAPSCLVLDLRLPGRGGLEIQREIGLSHISIPIIFITGHGEMALSAQAMKAGAVEFLSKPFNNQDLLDAVSKAIDRDRAARKQRNDELEIR
jgi:FixJ family two-component response regulator